MINDDQHNGYEASELLSATINLWKKQPTVRNEVRTCKLKSIANRAGELRLELSINVVLYFNGLEKEVVVNAQPFHTTTLGITTRNKDYKEECHCLKNLMDRLDEEFKAVIAEKIIMISKTLYNNTKSDYKNLDLLIMKTQFLMNDVKYS